MRILRVAQTLYPEVKGGGAYHVHAMSRDQAAMGHDVTVLTLSRSVDEPHRERRNGYDIVRYPVTASALGNDISLGVASFLQDAHSFDVIHAHSHLYFSTNLAALKRRLGDIPLAITNHGLYSQNAPKWLFDLYLRSIGQWTFNQADVVFCYTETEKKRIGSFGVDTQISVIANGVDTERFSPEGTESKLIDADGPVVLFVGRLVSGKRPVVAVKAFAEVLKEYPNAQLYFCGEGPLRDEAKAMTINLGIDTSVTFLKQVPYDEMPAVYRSGDVLVLPSSAEGVPRTILEALSTNVSVVSSELPQIRSVFGDIIRYAPIDDVDRFATQLIETLTQEKMSGVHPGFCWSQTVAKTTVAIESLVENG
ncbi:glycosyltransferase family 4 protein [Haloprofundus halophilus]|uniref:glycosyltransferase family 4 protein n=1 Tax=Haloprofundus halophilus TaxID=2283527 RepID=UPI000E44C0EA|nr:glycosyltransferase family 4 protein [Haloprofundus halophilus]